MSMPIKITGWRITIVLVLGALLAGGVYMIRNEAARAAVAERTAEWISDVQEASRTAFETERKHLERQLELEQQRGDEYAEIESDRQRVYHALDIRVHDDTDTDSDADTDTGTETESGTDGDVPDSDVSG